MRVGFGHRLLIIFFLQVNLFSQPFSENWFRLIDGISLGLFRVDSQSMTENPPVAVLKISPDAWAVDLYCSSQFEGTRRTLRNWSETFDLVAVTNAGMFGKDLSTSVGYLKSGNHINNSQINSRQRTILACGPLVTGIPAVQIIDLTCQDFTYWKDKYHSFLQSIRMISCTQKNVWQQQDQKWVLCATGMDTAGNLLLIHSGSPYTVHDFIDLLLKMPINIFNAMYLEGGVQAALYINQKLLAPAIKNDLQVSRFLSENDPPAWNIPNVIGISKKEN